LSPNKFQSLLGVDAKGTSGIPGLNSQLISGKLLGPEVLPIEALVDGDFTAGSWSGLSVFGTTTF
jgi:hypothetical protein